MTEETRAGKTTPHAGPPSHLVGMWARFQWGVRRRPTTWRLAAATLVIPFGFFIVVVAPMLPGGGPMGAVGSILFVLVFFILPLACIGTGFYLLISVVARRLSWRPRGLLTIVVYLAVGVLVMFAVSPQPPHPFDVLLWPTMASIAWSCGMDWPCPIE